MKTPFEIRQLYKKETANIPETITMCARIGKFGDIIIDMDDTSHAFAEEVEQTGYIDIPDPEYINWLEEKVLTLIKNTK